MPRAPKHCGINGCTVLVPNGKHCPDHANGWKTSPRTASSQITSQRRWRTFEAKILERDGHQCQIRYAGICTGRATVVDKIIPAARRPDLAFVPSNARAACAQCNQRKAQTTDRE